MGRKWGRTDQGDDHWGSRTGSAGTGEAEEVLNSETWRLQTSENASDVSHVAKHRTRFSVLHVAQMAYYWVSACTTPLRPRLFDTGSLSQNLCRPHAWLVKPKENASYPYTAIDEFLRMPIECVQTDNGTEFTKRFTKARLDEDLTLFERKLKEYGNLQKIHSMISSSTV